MFTTHFDAYVCDGDEITCEKGGFEVTASVQRDNDMGPPWKEHDGHGVVSDWRPKNSKRPGERIMCEDRGSCRFYDWAASIKIAKRDGWDAEPYGVGTKGERAVRAVQRDFESMKSWCENEWHWCGVVLSVSKGNVEILDHAASLWGIECNHPNGNNNHLMDVANELLDEAITNAEEAKNRICKALMS